MTGSETWSNNMKYKYRELTCIVCRKPVITNRECNNVQEHRMHKDPCLRTYNYYYQQGLKSDLFDEFGKSDELHYWALAAAYYKVTGKILNYEENRKIESENDNWYHNRQFEKEDEFYIQRQKGPKVKLPPPDAPEPVGKAMADVFLLVVIVVPGMLLTLIILGLLVKCGIV